jgi:peptidyl-prolyl cis-trans isomerase A (cyclophilin A)
VSTQRAIGLGLGVAACLMLVACSSNSTKTESTPIESKPTPAPDVFNVDLDTSKGHVVIEVHRAWAPIGADHFYTLVKTGFFDGGRFFRIVRNFVVQFGINGDPKINAVWSTANLPDDPVKETNAKGTLTYAKHGANTRSTQLFINLKNNAALDKDGFAPLGKVITGMEVVEKFYDSYGDMPPRGMGPDPSQIQVQGNAYLETHFPRLDYVKKATIQ